jgi:hypothetical protein
MNWYITVILYVSFWFKFFWYVFFRDKVFAMLKVLTRKKINRDSCFNPWIFLRNAGAGYPVLCKTLAGTFEFYFISILFIYQNSI